VDFLTRFGPVILAIGLVSCESGPKRANPIGEAFAGPAVLKIRKDIPLESPVVATVKHGDRLALLQKRRRFFKVRVPSGVEGWADERQLLAKEDMEKLRELAARAAKMPPQGQATAFGELNVHTQPSRQSPSFLQMKENEKFEVLTHVATPRTDLTRKALLPPPPRKDKPAVKKAPKEVRYPPLTPLPQPPGPPSNWLDLSRTDLSLEDSEESESEKEAKPIAMDDWSLIRTPGGESGWVLTRRLVMAIPDEVAQYAEGHRIVSYFSLGEVADDDKKKANWLWTTTRDGSREYDFDSFRVFVWSLRRHRYETAYIERNVHGYAPVLLEQVDLSAPNTKSKSAAASKFPGFSLCVENKQGQRVRRSYAFLTNIVRYAGEQPCEAAPLETVRASAPLPSGPEPQPAAGLLERMRARVRRLFRR
jgi:hypothetical protein